MTFDNLAPIRKENIPIIRAVAPMAQVVVVPPESLIKRDGKVLELPPKPTNSGGPGGPYYKRVRRPKANHPWRGKP